MFMCSDTVLVVLESLLRDQTDSPSHCIIIAGFELVLAAAAHSGSFDVGVDQAECAGLDSVAAQTCKQASYTDVRCKRVEPARHSSRDETTWQRAEPGSYQGLLQQSRSFFSCTLLQLHK